MENIEREESGPEKVASTFKGAERGTLPMKNINEDPSEIVVPQYLFSLPYMQGNFCLARDRRPQPGMAMCYVLASGS